MDAPDSSFLIDGSEDATVTFLFAHGAGAPMDSPFMNSIADRLSSGGVRVMRFEFPYMAARRKGGKRGPDRAEVLIHTWLTAIESAEGRHPLFIGGKSLGGRIATMSASRANVSGVVCFGYPFHPPGRPEKLRTAHLADMRVPVLILQGERDPFGTPAEVQSYELSRQVTIEWIPDGDHSLVPRKRSGHTVDSNLNVAVQKTLSFFKKPALV